VFRRAEFFRRAGQCHVIKYSRFEDLHSGKHQFACGALGFGWSGAVEETADSPMPVNVDGTVRIGMDVGTQDQRRCGPRLAMQRDQLGQVHVDQHVGIHDDKCAGV
jgi:hypothetical protein